MKLKNKVFLGCVLFSIIPTLTAYAAAIHFTIDNQTNQNIRFVKKYQDCVHNGKYALPAVAAHSVERGLYYRQDNACARRGYPPVAGSALGADMIMGDHKEVCHVTFSHRHGSSPIKVSHCHSKPFFFYPEGNVLHIR